MSVNQYVAISSKKLPTATDWESAVEKLGFDIRIDPVDLTKHHGYLPVQFLSQNAGFELFLNQSQDFEESEVDLSKYDIVIQFTTFSEQLEGQCAMVCAAGLVTCCDGVYFDENDQVFHDSVELVSIAKEWISGS
jgi:hypothetical protein